MQKTQIKTIKVSVRQLVEFVMRGGDLDSRLMGSDRALEGTRGHQAVQKGYGPQDQAEVTLTYSTTLRDCEIEVKGRADGILIEQGQAIIDEIKTVTKPLEGLEEMDNQLHWGQVMVYGFIYGQQKEYQEITLQLTYYHIATEETKRARRVYQLPELEAFFYDLLDAYIRWGEQIIQWRQVRDQSISQLDFPFTSYRRGQRNLAIGVYRTIKEKKRLFAKAPTGIGKTMSTLFPAIKAMGEGHSTKIFYLTAKTIARTVAEEAIEKLLSKGLRLKTITLTAKDKICFEKDARCNPEECVYAKGHFDRLNQGLQDLFQATDCYTREVVELYAQKHQLCPFEFSLEIALWVDCVICDYNYVFDPRVYLKRFFWENKEPFTFLIDEAHNLVDRGREMFSAALTKQAFLDMKNIMKEQGQAVAKAANRVNSQMLKLKKHCGEEALVVDKRAPEEIYSSLYQFIEVAEAWLLEHDRNQGHEALLELYFNVVSFLKISELYDERYVTLVEQSGRDLNVKLYCVDPSFLLREAVNRGSAAVYFSGTLTPIDFYRNLLGGEESDYVVTLGSPYKKENLQVLIANRVSTKYKQRQKSYEIIADYLYQVIQARAGNYFVFFPSYQYMDAVYQCFGEKYQQIRTLKQAPLMMEEEREAFINEFTSQREETLVGFVVLGGIFSEGIDLPGKSLIGAIIVGVGLPQICPEVDVIKDYFQDKNNNGYGYAYQYPGMNKVLQAAGRVIRTETDQGIVLLIDDRYTSESYQKILPREWYHYRLISRPKEIKDILYDFWNQKQPKL